MTLRDGTSQTNSARMEGFYGHRRRFDILMNGPDLVGRRWNFDEDNHEPPPKKQETSAPRTRRAVSSMERLENIHPVVKQEANQAPF